MENKTFFNIALRIILLFAVGMLMTLVPENLRTFFGDIPCDQAIYVDYGGKVIKGCGPNGFVQIDDGWDWGARHYWYAWMTVFLFLLSVANLITYSVKTFENQKS